MRGREKRGGGYPPSQKLLIPTQHILLYSIIIWGCAFPYINKGATIAISMHLHTDQSVVLSKLPPVHTHTTYLWQLCGRECPRRVS